MAAKVQTSARIMVPLRLFMLINMHLYLDLEILMKQLLEMMVEYTLHLDWKTLQMKMLFISLPLAQKS